MNVAWLIVGDASVHDHELFGKEVPEGQKSQGAKDSASTDDLVCQFCFHTDDQLTARRWAILCAMQGGAHIKAIKAVHRSISKMGEHYVFMINGRLERCKPHPTPEGALHDEAD